MISSATPVKAIGRLFAYLPLCFIVGGLALLWAKVLMAQNLPIHLFIKSSLIWLATCLAVTLLCLPMGLALAIFLQNHARRPSARLISTVITTLSSVPGLLFGVFILLLFQGWDLPRHWSAVPPLFTLTTMMTFMVAHRVGEALRLASPKLSLSALALGATPMQISWRLLLPAVLGRAMSGILKSLGQLVGLTAPLLVFTADYDWARPLPLYLFEGLTQGSILEGPIADGLVLGILCLWLMTLAINGLSLLFNIAHEHRARMHREAQ